MIDLRKLRNSRPELTNAKLGELFFSDHKHPEKAVARLLSGKSEMTESQIRILASFLAVKPGDLFEIETQNGWLDKTEKNGIFTIQKGRYTATYDSEKGITTLFCEGKKINEIILSQASYLGKFIELLDNAILVNEENVEDLS